MRTRVLAALSALAGLVALTLAPAAAAAPPLPFGHACAPREGALYCVEVPGRDAPTYRPSNGSFSVEVSRLRVTVPTRERRPRQMAPLTGGCLCGAVRFAVSEPLGGLMFCHCRRCQRRTGTAFGVGATAAPRSVSVTAGADELRTYTPETGFAKQFCGRCGSQLFTVDPADGDVRFVRFGTLDEPPELPVLGHQFVAYAAPWHPLPDDGAPRFDERMPLR